MVSARRVNGDVETSYGADFRAKCRELADRLGADFVSSAIECSYMAKFIVGLATALGVVMNFTSLNPIRALYWTAVINGVVAVPVMIILMLMTRRPEIMGEFIITGWLSWLGWAATVAMAACVVGMVIGWFG